MVPNLVLGPFYTGLLGDATCSTMNENQIEESILIVCEYSLVLLELSMLSIRQEESIAACCPVTRQGNELGQVRTKAGNRANWEWEREHSIAAAGEAAAAAAATRN